MDGTWRMATSATVHCLTGCAIGEILGMVIGTAVGLPAAATVVLAIALAFVFGYALTMRGLLRSGLAFGASVRVALAADTVSIAVMELVDNTVIVAVPGAMGAGLASVLFWVTLIASLAVAFVVTVPVNHFMIRKGKGHAVVHQMHDSAAHGTQHAPMQSSQSQASQGQASQTEDTRAHGGQHDQHHAP